MVAQPTLLGWIVSGSYKNNCLYERNSSVNHLENIVCVNIKLSQESLERFWDIESVGIKPHEINTSLENNKVWNDFLENLEYSPYLKAYRVTIPWRDEQARASLGDNYLHALKRLQNLHNKTFYQ